MLWGKQQANLTEQVSVYNKSDRKYHVFLDKRQIMYIWTNFKSYIFGQM